MVTSTTSQDTWFKNHEKLKHSPVRPPERPKLQPIIHGFQYFVGRVRNGSKLHKHFISSDKAPTQILSIHRGDVRVSVCDKCFSGVTRFIEKLDKYVLSDGLIEHGNFYHGPGHVVQKSRETETHHSTTFRTA
ncbi:hypothetical protein KSS87_010929 [Heliosperma pusillum]|nr:hypothetical protein KSS87_010929 [Heliosperma pusillum]